MLDIWQLINRETDKVEMEGALQEILEELDVPSPEEISDQYTLTKPQNHSTGDHEKEESMNKALLC